MTRRTLTLVITLLAIAGMVSAQFDQPGVPLAPWLDGPGGGPQWATAGNEHIRVEVVNSLADVEPGQAFHIAVKLNIGEEWVFYSPDPGSSAGFTPIAGSVVVEADALEIGQALWLADGTHATELGPGEVMVNNVYEGQTVVYVSARVLPGSLPGPQRLTVTIDGQLCSDERFECINVHKNVIAVVRVAAQSTANPNWTGPLAAGLQDAMTADELRARHAARPPAGPAGGIDEEVAGWTIWTGLSLAVLAGLILNVMPCVLPVIPIRIMSIVEAAQGSRRRFVTLGLAFAFGIVLFFVGLSVVNVILRLATDELFNWGRHFQLMPFRIGLAMLMVALACNLFGVFTVMVPRKIMAMDSGVSARAGGHLGAMGMGVMMAILATPCSFATLMGVLGWASVKPIWLGTLAIVLVGVGMAAPHAMLSAFPSLVNKLPKPGRWMELLKQGMGFAVLAVAAWLIGTLSETSYVMQVACFGVLLAFALWAWGVWVRYDAPLSRKLLIRGGAIVLVAVAGVGLLRPPRPLAVKFEPFSEARIVEARQEGHIVLVKFSATWCISCGIVDRIIYNDPDVQQELIDRGVVAIKGDVTARSAPANRLLYEQLRGAPPLTVIYPPGEGEPIRLRGKFSHADLTAALDQAAGGP